VTGNGGFCRCIMQTISGAKSFSFRVAFSRSNNAESDAWHKRCSIRCDSRQCQFVDETLFNHRTSSSSAGADTATERTVSVSGGCVDSRLVLGSKHRGRPTVGINSAPLYVDSSISLIRMPTSWEPELQLCARGRRYLVEPRHESQHWDLIPVSTST
jgi:hypothetical protein